MDKIAEERITDPRIGVFCPSIGYCDRFAAAMPHAAPFHSGISYDAYQDRLRRFRRGQLQALVTVAKFNERIALPHLNVLVILPSNHQYTNLWEQLRHSVRDAPANTNG